jgi:hypothetical protein
MSTSADCAENCHPVLLISISAEVARRALMLANSRSGPDIPLIAREAFGPTSTSVLSSPNLTSCVATNEKLPTSANGVTTFFVSMATSAEQVVPELQDTLTSATEISLKSPSDTSNEACACRRDHWTSGNDALISIGLADSTVIEVVAPGALV